MPRTRLRSTLYKEFESSEGGVFTTPENPPTFARVYVKNPTFVWKVAKTPYTPET
jgi:hypothetical protein